MSDTPAADLDLENQWSELRSGNWWFGRREGDVRPALWLFPVMLLYTGFFFGPFATAVAAVVTLRGRIDLRAAGIVVGVCGSVWCLLQGLSLYNGAWWSEIELQSMRSGLNFLAGIATYVVIRPAAVRRYRAAPRTLVITFVAIALAVVAFVIVPSPILVALGR